MSKLYIAAIVLPLIFLSGCVGQPEEVPTTTTTPTTTEAPSGEVTPTVTATAIVTPITSPATAPKVYQVDVSAGIGVVSTS